MNLKCVAARETRNVNLRSGEQFSDEFLALAGAPMVPALDFGDTAYGQSIALIEWLDIVHPHPRLIPEAPEDALAVRELALSIACDIHPLNTPRVLKHLTEPMGHTEEMRKQWYAHWVHEGFTTLEGKLSKHEGRGPFCVGQDPTLADICLVPQVLNARRFGVNIDGYHRINAIDAHCRSLAAFQTAAPKTD